MPDRRRSPQFEEAAQLLGRKVAVLRQHRGLTQETLSERTGLSRNQIQNIEHSRGNQRGPNGQPRSGNARLDTVYVLAQVLDVRAADLVDPAVTEDDLLRIVTSPHTDDTL